MGAYVVRTSRLNDKHSCQLFRIDASFSSLVLFSSSVSTANLSYLQVASLVYVLLVVNYFCIVPVNVVVVFDKKERESNEQGNWDTS